VLTKIVEHIHIVSWHVLGQHGAHLTGKDLVPQALGFANLVLVFRPSHHDGFCWTTDR
jgi:hypothetical protein